MDEKLNFLSSSIQDVQATIRAIDSKVAALLVVLCFPLANIGKIAGHIDNVISKDPGFITSVIIFTFLLLWVLSLVAAARVISAIDNPAQHIINSNGHKGTYYGSGLYKTTILDVFHNSSSLKASKTVSSYHADFPSSKDSIVKELVFEQMKLAYIRDMKLCRLNFGVRASFGWFVAGVYIYLRSRYM